MINIINAIDFLQGMIIALIINLIPFWLHLFVTEHIFTLISFPFTLGGGMSYVEGGKCPGGKVSGGRCPTPVVVVVYVSSQLGSLRLRDDVFQWAVSGQSGRPGLTAVLDVLAAFNVEHALVSTEFQSIQPMEELFHVMEKPHRRLPVLPAVQVCWTALLNDRTQLVFT